MSNLDVGTSRVSLNGFALTGAPPVSPPFHLLHIQTTEGSAASEGESSLGPAATVTISLPARFFSEIQYLQTHDQTTYTQVLTHITDNLSRAVQNSTGQEQELLSQLRNRFQQAADGDLSALLPQLPQVSSNLLALPPTPHSTLGRVLDQQPLNTDLLATQIEQSTLTDLVTIRSPQATGQSEATGLLQDTDKPQDTSPPPSARVNLFAAQSLPEPTLGDLFTQSPESINFQGVVAVYSHAVQNTETESQLLTSFFPAQNQPFSAHPLSQNIQQTLDTILNEVNATYAVVAKTSSGS